MVPDIHPVIVAYLEESLKTYNIRALLSSTIALGCASEKALLLQSRPSQPPLRSPTRPIVSVKDRRYFHKEEVRRVSKRLDVVRPQLPKDLSDGLDIILTGIFEMIRVNRNDRGHPTGTYPPREQVYASLQLFIPYVQRTYALIAHFKAKPVRLVTGDGGT